MKKILPVIPFLIVITLTNVKGQSNPSDSLQQPKLVSYFFTVQSGALFGCSDCQAGKDISFSTSTLHGIKIGKKLRVGAGLGFDSYSDWRAVPIFGSISWDLFGKNNKVFTQLNYGKARAWKPFGEREFGLIDTRGGRAFSTMIGYRITSGKMNIAVLAGYKFQSATAYYEYPYYSWLLSDKRFETSNKQTIRENMNRFAISLSVGFR
jgi:hypothetical protein